MEEFKKLYSNPKTDELFRMHVKRSRNANEKDKADGKDTHYVPFNMSKFLEHMSLKQRRETVVNRLEKQYLNYKETPNMCKNFIKLFVID
jgi:hypothetical protein